MTNTNKLSYQVPEVSAKERRRLQALHKYKDPDATPRPDPVLDALAGLVAAYVKIPIVYINLVDKDKIFTQACFGAQGGVMPRGGSLCQLTLDKGDFLELLDIDRDPLAQEHVKLIEEKGIRYYAGIPFCSSDGFDIETLCLMDEKPNALSKEQIRNLRVYSEIITSRLELLRQNRELNELNRNKEKFMRKVSHDMRNPLLGIVGFSESLYQETEDEGEKEIYGIMLDAGRRMMTMVNHLLNAEYIRNETLSLALREVDPAELTREAVAHQEPFVTMKEQILDLKLPENRRFQLDPDRWKHIVSNLLNNAVKFTPRKGRISITLEILESESRSLLLRVQDTGIGMTSRQVQDLFSKGISHHRRGTEGEETTGLGMLFVKRSVDLHQGTIDVSSVPGEGTLFTILIPE